MIQSNFDYLRKQIMYTGFGDMEFQLKDKMEKDLPTFQIHHKPDFGKGEVEATANLRRNDDGRYYFNTYDVEVKRDNSEGLKQTFYVEKPKEAIIKNEDGTEKKEWVNSTITLKEAANMMDLDENGQGRSVRKEFVNKDNEKYTSYIRLDFTNTDKDGNYQIKKMADFDLEAKLVANQNPIKELSQPESKKQLLESLYKGNEQSITVLHNGQEFKRYIKTNPQFKTITVSDEKGHRIRQGQKENETMGQSAKQGEKENQKQTDESGDNNLKNTPKNSKSQKNNNRHRQSMS